MTDVIIIIIIITIIIIICLAWFRLRDLFVSHYKSKSLLKVVLVFVSHTVDISKLSVAACLALSVRRIGYMYLFL